MPELLRSAAGAIIRPGFNSVWECISGRTPFIAIAGTTREEPVGQRMRSLTCRGIGAAIDVNLWEDEEWIANFHCRCDETVLQWKGEPRADVLGEVIRGSSARKPRMAGYRNVPARLIKKARVEASQRLRPLSDRPPDCVFLRIDDVVQNDASFQWVLRECSARHVPLSLEIIPYLSELNDEEFDTWAYQGHMTVSQHGFSHVPEFSGNGRVGEFAGPREDIPSFAREYLGSGRRKMMHNFPRRFGGGYSPPYDGLPPWLPDVWSSIGGSYISMLNPPEHSSLPILRAHVDLWNWRVDRPRPATAILIDVQRELDTYHYAGIVLHVNQLESEESRVCFIAVLDLLADANLWNGSLSSAFSLLKTDPALPLTKHMA